MDVPVLAFSGVILTGVLTAFGVILKIQAERLTEVEAKVRKAKKYNERLWLYTRNLIDLYYRHRVEGSPDPPALPEED